MHRCIGWGLWLAVLGAAAAPVGGIDEVDKTANPVIAAPQPGRAGAQAGAAPRAPSPDAATGTGTGNKNLDLLLEIHGKSEEEGRQPARGSAAAASAAAAELAALRAKAAERPDRAASDAGAGVSKQVRSIFEGAPATDAEGRPLNQGAERREWAGRPAGGGSGKSGGVLVEAGGVVVDSRYGQEGMGDENVLRRLPAEVIEFLRENRYWVLGGLVAVAVLVAGSQAQGRRR